MKNSKTITVHLDCTNSQGEPDTFSCDVELSLWEKVQGMQVSKAIDKAVDAGYVSPFVCTGQFEEINTVKQSFIVYIYSLLYKYGRFCFLMRPKYESKAIY
jgi:hypothetical protein